MSSPSSARAQSPLEAKTLKLYEARYYNKRALRHDYTVRRYKASCARRSRLRIRCRARWRDEFDLPYRATGYVWRTGVLGDDREHFRATIHRPPGNRPDHISGVFTEETRFSDINHPLTLLGQDDFVRVTPQTPIDPLPTSEGNAPSPGTRYIAVPVVFTNVGGGRFDDSLIFGAQLLMTDGRTVSPSLMFEPPCDQDSVDMPPGQTRLACAAFLVAADMVPRAFEYHELFGSETGEWRLTY